MTDAPRVELRPLIQARGLKKIYEMSGRPLVVLQDCDLDVQEGEILALVGKSGAGKSTLLHLLGTLDAPSEGTVLFEGEDVYARDEVALADFRNSTVGFVFQSHYLLPELTAVDNAALPLLVRRVPKEQARERAREILAQVGLGHRLDHRPGELSGGEQQRVALARAIVTKPRLLLADEPTGNLDPRTGGEIHELLFQLNRDLRMTTVVVTHHEELARRMPRCLRMEAGRVVPG